MTTESNRAAAILAPRDRVISEPPAHQPTAGARERPSYGRRASALGAVVGIVIAAVPGVAGLLVQGWGPLILLSLFGTPGTGLLGWRLVGRALSGLRGEAFGLAIGMGFGAYVLGVTLFTVATVAWRIAGETEELAVIIGPVATFGFGLLFMSPSLVITIPSAVIWIVVVRRLSDAVVRPDEGVR